MTTRPAVVAVVDDDAAMCRAMGRMIEVVGMVPRLYPSAEAMLGSAPEAIDCLVVDLHLPGMNGIELAERFDGAVPVIFMSASEDAEARIGALPGGPRTLLAKPFTGEELLETLERTVGAAHPELAPRSRRRDA